MISKEVTVIRDLEGHGSGGREHVIVGPVARTDTRGRRPQAAVGKSGQGR